MQLQDQILSLFKSVILFHRGVLRCVRVLQYCIKILYVA